MFGIHDLALFVISGLLLNIRASERIKVNPAVSLWLNRVTGGLFVWLGVKLALAKSH
jgi:threonine/homoserine/homoserine lactone efflux protein